MFSQQFTYYIWPNIVQIWAWRTCSHNINCNTSSKFKACMCHRWGFMSADSWRQLASEKKADCRFFFLNDLEFSSKRTHRNAIRVLGLQDLAKSRNVPNVPHSSDRVCNTLSLLFRSLAFGPLGIKFICWYSVDILNCSDILGPYCFIK